MFTSSLQLQGFAPRNPQIYFLKWLVATKTRNKISEKQKELEDFYFWGAQSHAFSFLFTTLFLQHSFLKGFQNSGAVKLLLL